MTTAYFLTGSYNDQDNDFELTITISNEINTGSDHKYNAVLIDISSENKVIWESVQPSFLLCLKDLEEFIIENNITLYSKILTSPLRDQALDKELEGFILNRLDY